MAASSSLPIAILGSGISGLLVARALLRASPSLKLVVLDRAGVGASLAGNKLALSLEHDTISRIAKLMNEETGSLLAEAGVRTPNGLSDVVDGDVEQSSSSSWHSISRHVLASKLAAALPQETLEQAPRELVKIEWRAGHGQALRLRFKDGEALDARWLIAADGVHSAGVSLAWSRYHPHANAGAVRGLMAEQVKHVVHPFVAIHGSRRLSPASFASSAFAEALRHSPKLVHKTAGARVQLSLDEWTEERVAISWTYIRRAQGDADPLYKPDRSKKEASVVSDAFDGELIDALGGAPPTFAALLEGAVAYDGKPASDRRLSWLLRTVPMEAQSDAARSALARAIFVGDAAHAVPIVCSYGVKDALDDAESLAEAFARHGETAEAAAVQQYIDEAASRWEATRAFAKARLDRVAEQH